jgi:protein-tyrosine kinase
MSLVEQAGKRLEELRRAGSEVAGDLSFPVSAPEQLSTPAAPSTIERAISELERRASRRSAEHVAFPAANESAGHRVAGDDLDLESGAEVRREPRLGDAGGPGPGASTPASGVRPGSRLVQLDFASLAARGYLTPDDPEAALANQFRKVKWPLLQACQNKSQPRVENANRIMVTSSLAGEGKSFVALNLALSIATERDHSVLLIDADTTRPSLSRLLGISSEPGLLDLVSAKDASPEKSILRTNIEKLTVLAAGIRRPHATELLASEAMERLVEQLAAEYVDRILIFDAPPLLAAPEPAVLASHMGQIVVVAEAGRTTHATLKSALAAVESRPVVRMVLNKATNRHESYSYAG